MYCVDEVEGKIDRPGVRMGQSRLVLVHSELPSTQQRHCGSNSAISKLQVSRPLIVLTQVSIHNQLVLSIHYDTRFFHHVRKTGLQSGSAVKDSEYFEIPDF